jgi:hypothetical protein
LAGRDDVGAEVAEGGQATVVLDRPKAPKASPRHVLEEDALDRILRAEVEDLVEARLDERDHEDAIVAARTCLRTAAF